MDESTTENGDTLCIFEEKKAMLCASCVIPPIWLHIQQAEMDWGTLLILLSTEPQRRSDAVHACAHSAH